MTTKAELVGYIFGIVMVMALVAYVITNVLASPIDQLARFDEQVIANCTEDMDCWDCETMGNRICGPRREDDQ